MCMKGKQKAPIKSGVHCCRKCLATSKSKEDLCKPKKVK